MKELLDEVELLLVVGSTQLVELGAARRGRAAAGVAAHLVDDAGEIDRGVARGRRDVVGITSGASAPERLVSDVCDWFRERGVDDIAEHRSVYEDVVFKLPVELRRAERSAA